MMMKSMLTATAALVAFAAPTIVARAAAPGFCADYARSAVAQYRTNRSIPGCFKGSDLRWHPDYNYHFNWCLGANPARAEAERDYRRGALGGCRARAGYRTNEVHDIVAKGIGVAIGWTFSQIPVSAAILRRVKQQV